MGTQEIRRGVESALALAKDLNRTHVVVYSFSRNPRAGGVVVTIKKSFLGRKYNLELCHTDIAPGRFICLKIRTEHGDFKAVMCMTSLNEGLGGFPKQ